mgnify:CR=1 FL=1
MAKLRISEIFYSLQGETNTMGLATVFIRLTGCPLRCTYCDTEYAFNGGTNMTLSAILEKVAAYSPRYVTVTGGEPLAQKHCHQLLTRLCDQGYRVSLETGGALDISGVDPRVIKVLDLKTPASNECERNLYQNLEYLSSQDQIKFVICDTQDYDWAKQQVEQRNLAVKCEILFSPSYQQQSPTELAEKILADNLPVRMQIQLHKYLWGDLPGK